MGTDITTDPNTRAAAISGPVIPHADPATSPSGLGVRRTFRDDELQRRFETDGYAVVPFLDEATADRLREIYREVGPAPGDERSGYFPGNVSDSPDWKRRVIAAVEPLIADRVAELFDDHHAFHTTFMVKWPGPDGKLQSHSDPTMVDDEGRYHSLNIWCPLVDPVAGDEKGFVRVVPGSTGLPMGQWYRARGGHVPSGFDAAEDDVFDRLAMPVPLAAGDALALDHRLVHCSSPNLSDEPRLVLAIGLRPAEATNIHVECDADGWVDFWAVDDEYFIRHPAVDMADYPLVRRIERQVAPALDVASFERLVGLPVTVAPEPVAPEPVAPEPVARPTAAAATTVPPRRSRRPLVPGRAGVVLRDRRLDRRLRRDGFVKIPLLSAAQAADLRAEFGRLHGWEGSGFEVDFWSSDPAYRRATAAAIAAATDDALAAAFVDHEPFLRNFLVKWPGERHPDGFPEAPHRDWMYTDERSGQKSWVVWIALQDIDGDNGQLQVARGSHRLDRMLRGSGLTTEWLEHRGVLDRRMLATPVRAGEAIVLDAAVVHGSYSNLSTEPRVVAAVAVAGAGVPLVHYQQTDEDVATRYELGREFFVEQRVEDLSGPLPYPATPGVSVGRVDISPRDLARRLDRQPLAVVDRVESLLVAARRRRAERAARQASS